MYYKCKFCNAVLPKRTLNTEMCHACIPDQDTKWPMVRKNSDCAIAVPESSILWKCAHCDRSVKDEEYYPTDTHYCRNGQFVPNGTTCYSYLVVLETKKTKIPKPKQLLIFPKETKEFKVSVDENAPLQDVMAEAKKELEGSNYRSISFKYRGFYYVIAKLKETPDADKTS